MGTPTEPCQDTCVGAGVFAGVPLVLVSRVQMLKGNNAANQPIGKKLSSTLSAGEPNVIYVIHNTQHYFGLLSSLPSHLFPSSVYPRL